jgi:hypothetical protein
MYHHPVAMKTGLSYAVAFQHSSHKYAYAGVSSFCGSLTRETSTWVELQVRGVEYDFF